jgi:DNA replication and repair protein RecF
VKIVRQGETTKKEYIINDVVLRRLLLPKMIPIVLFEPNHLLLLSGGPELRRDYIDELLEQTVVGYATLRRQYKRALAQRNALLKHNALRYDQLFAWNIRLSQLGGQVAEARLRLVSDIARDISDLYAHLSKTSSTVELSYASSCNTAQYSSDLLHKLEQNQSIDIERGFTAHGPHRDDMRVLLNGHPVQDTASRGETRTMLLALKVLELRLLERERGQKPVLLLDDVFSELDGSRRRALTEELVDYQTFITTTDADMVIEYFDSSTIIPINKG